MIREQPKIFPLSFALYILNITKNNTKHMEPDSLDLGGIKNLLRVPYEGKYTNDVERRHEDSQKEVQACLEVITAHLGREPEAADFLKCAKEHLPKDIERYYLTYAGITLALIRRWYDAEGTYNVTISQIM